MEETIKRIPPHSIEAEQSVLGSLIMDRDAVLVANSIISSKDFYFPDLKLLFEVITSLYKCDKPIDLVTIQDSLKVSGQLELIGGVDKISALALSVPTSAQVEEYANIVRVKAYMRRAIQFANNVLAEAYKQDYDQTLTVLNNVPSIDVKKAKHMSIEQIMQMGVDDIAKRLGAADDTRGVRTGFSVLDYKTSGMKEGEVIGLKAGPNIGKSILAINIAANVARRGEEVAFFAYEMSNKQLAYRLMPGEFKIDIGTLVHPKTKLKRNHSEVIQQYLPDNLHTLHIYADELEQNTVVEIESKLRLLVNLKLIVIDYLHLMRLDESLRNDIDKYTIITRALKKVAQKYNVPVLVILSETKDGSVRGTNELLHDFDQLWEVVREKDAATKEGREAAELLLLKGRDNALGKVKLKYLEDYLMFNDWE